MSHLFFVHCRSYNFSRFKKRDDFQRRENERLVSVWCLVPASSQRVGVLIWVLSVADVLVVVKVCSPPRTIPSPYASLRVPHVDSLESNGYIQGICRTATFPPRQFWEFPLLVEEALVAGIQ